MVKGAFPNGPTPLIQLVDTSAFTILPHKSTRGHGTSHHRDLVDNRCSRVLGESHKKPNAPGTKSLSMVPRISCRAAALCTALHGADAVSKTDVMSCGKRSVSTTRKTKKQRERERENISPLTDTKSPRHYAGRAGPHTILKFWGSNTYINNAQQMHGMFKVFQILPG